MLLAALCSAVPQACTVHRQSSAVATGVEPAKFRNFLVVRSPDDERGVADVIAAELRRRGLGASVGPVAAAPPGVDAVVRYEARWTWDVTPYLLDLRIYLRSPSTDDLLATGAAFHSSLGRKSPEEMAAEILSSLLGPGGGRGP